MSLKMVCTVVSAIAILGTSIFSRAPALAAGEVMVVEVKLLTPGGEINPMDGEPLYLTEGEHVEVLVTLEKASNFGGIITLSSDLEQLTGLTRFQLAEYRQTNIPIELSGAVPAALMNHGKETILSEHNFVLLTILFENQTGRKTLLNLSATATTILLERSKAEIAEVAKSISKSDNRETQALASKMLESARDAWKGGNPELALSLCEQAREILALEITRVDPPSWYLVIPILLALGGATGWMLFLRREGRIIHNDFSIRSKKTK